MISVSNIAWSPEEDAAAFQLLREMEIGHIEVAPGRIWPAAGETPRDQVASAMASLHEAGLGISGFQAILFGKPELKLFDETSNDLRSYLERLAAVCAEAGGQYLVFGAPKNRWIPEGMDPAAAFEKAVSFFRILGATASKLGVTFGIEANPEAYGCNFCTHAADVAALVRTVDSPGVRWHLDAGEFAMNSEPVRETILAHADLIGSMHVSQPNLGDFASPWDGHASVAAALNEAGYSGPISLEMKRPPEGLSGVRQAISFLLATYQ